MNPFLFLLLSCFFLSCSREANYPGFSETETGLYYQMRSVGSGTEVPRVGDYLELHLVYKTEKDSVFFDTQFEFPTGVLLPFTKPAFTGSFQEHLAKLTEGDSVTYLVNGDSLFGRFLMVPPPPFIAKGSKVKLELKLSRILGPEEYKEKVKQLQGRAEDMDMEEYRKLHAYLEKNRITMEPFESGLYYLPLKEGTGARVAAGKTVILHYRGCLLDGTVFDSSYDTEPFEFIVGKEDQLIWGLEEGICRMKEGGKAKFILPSQLAYGSKGSSTGTVPPYTTLVYEVEVIKVK